MTDPKSTTDVSPAALDREAASIALKSCRDALESAGKALSEAMATVAANDSRQSAMLPPAVSVVADVRREVATCVYRIDNLLTGTQDVVAAGGCLQSLGVGMACSDPAVAYRRAAMLKPIIG